MPPADGTRWRPVEGLLVAKMTVSSSPHVAPLLGLSKEQRVMDGPPVMATFLSSGASRPPR